MMRSNVTLTLNDAQATKSEEQLVQFCSDELAQIGIPFPRHMKIGERQELLKNEQLSITLRKLDQDAYRFFYCAYHNGHGTTFRSAKFSADFA